MSFVQGGQQILGKGEEVQFGMEKVTGSFAACASSGGIPALF